MENKARYTVVGIFLFTFTIAMVLFVLWLARYDSQEANAREFRLYSKSSVAGLGEKSLVEYKGLKIGFVESIQIDPNNSEQVEIILKIKKPSIIKVDSVAIIESQGVTGNKHIVIEGGTATSKALFDESMDFAVIPLKKSFLDELTSQAGSITEQINLVLARLNVVLKEDNLQQVDQLLVNLNKAVNNFDSTLTSVNKTFDQQLPATLSKINTIVDNDLKTTLSNVNDLSGSINLVVKEDVKKILKEFEATVKATQNVDDVLSGLEKTLEKVDDTLDRVNQDAGSMIFQTRDLQYGPGEEK